MNRRYPRRTLATPCRSFLTFQTKQPNPFQISGLVVGLQSFPLVGPLEVTHRTNIVHPASCCVEDALEFEVGSKRNPSSNKQTMHPVRSAPHDSKQACRRAGPYPGPLDRRIQAPANRRQPDPGPPRGGGPSLNETRPGPTSPPAPAAAKWPRKGTVLSSITRAVALRPQRAQKLPGASGRSTKCSRQARNPNPALDPSCVNSIGWRSLSRPRSRLRTSA